MVDETASDNEIDRRWWRRIRRSFGVPDLVGDELARTAIIEDLAAADPVQLRRLAEAVLDAVIELGPSGQLDERFLDEAQRKRLQAASLLPKPASTVVAERAWAIYRKGGASHGYDAVDVPAESNALGSALLDKISEHVKARPFERARRCFEVDQAR